MASVRALLNEPAALDGLERIIPSHGNVVETDGRDALRAVAKTL